MPFKSVGDELNKFKAGTLHSGGSGDVVTNPKQALAIALSEQARAKGNPERRNMRQRAGLTRKYGRA